MDYSFFFNHLSLPASGENQAYELLNEAFQGVLHIKQNEDRIFLYFDGETIYDCELSEGFTYSDFKNKLFSEDRDLLELINDIEDKAPLLNFVSEELTNELFQRSSYFKERPYDKNLDIFTTAWIENGIMLSLATDVFWDRHKIRFSSSAKEQYIPDKCDVYNISQETHADLILHEMKENIQNICPDTIFTDNFKTWYEECKNEDKNKIKNKLQHCYNNNFQLGRPVIDTLSSSRFANMKEVRVGNAHAQSGKIRILFAMNEDRSSVILHGFIKHSDDYTEHIRIADNIFDKLK